MTFESMQLLKRQSPFVEFKIELANGQILHVPSADCFLVTKRGMIVGNPHHDRIVIFELLDIRSVTISGPSQA